MITKRMHSTANDMVEGQVLFQLIEGTTLVYNVAGLKAADGKIMPIIDDVRLTPRRWEYKGADYLANFTGASQAGFPADFAALCVATGTNAHMNPAGTGAVLVAKANISATMGDSTILTDTPTTAFGTVIPPVGGGGVVPPVVGGGVVVPGVVPGVPETAAEKKKRLAAENDGKGLSTGVWVGIGLGVVAVIGAIVAFVVKPWKD